MRKDSTEATEHYRAFPGKHEGEDTFNALKMKAALSNIYTQNFGPNENKSFLKIYWWYANEARTKGYRQTKKKIFQQLHSFDCLQAISMHISNLEVYT